MPYKIIKRNNGRFKVINAITKKVYSKNTSLKNAKKQIRLLYLIENNPNYIKNNKITNKRKTKLKSKKRHTKKNIKIN
jgi:hypothetical protein